MSHIQSDALRRRTSCLSDCGSSECSSIPSIGGSPTTFRVESQGSFQRQSVHHCMTVPGSHKQSRQALVTSPTTSTPCRSPEPPAARPLCLDFLNGKCGRQRAHCRYYHPQPGDVTLVVPPNSPGPACPTAAVAGTVNDPARPICEVWALTGFCKYGPRCWKQHPQLTAQLASPVAEPITHKFQQWLQTRLQAPSQSVNAPQLAVQSSNGSAHVPSPTSRRSSQSFLDTPRSPASGWSDNNMELLQLALDRLRGPSTAWFIPISPVSAEKLLEQETESNKNGPQLMSPALAKQTLASPVPATQAPCLFVHQPYAL
eukprot:GGOE01012630.1.p1 GENE.GGOE01012630.1~~GGOE01012630.1.p1  ORF type:complete len:334 (+),score=37.02 GGOE01012630.1:59-1003(+)